MDAGEENKWKKKKVKGCWEQEERGGGGDKNPLSGRNQLRTPDPGQPGPKAPPQPRPPVRAPGRRCINVKI